FPPRVENGTQIEAVEQPVGLRARAAFQIEPIIPIPCANRLVVVLRPDGMVGPYRIGLVLGSMRNAFVDEEFAPRWWRRWSRPVCADREKQPVAVVVIVERLGDLWRGLQQWPPGASNKRMRVLDERRREQTTCPDQKTTS